MFRILALLLALAGAPAHATTVVALDVSEQASESDAFVIAVVGESKVEVTTDRWYTDTRLDVEKVLGGQAPRSITVRQLGGEHDGKMLYLPGDARLEAGQRIAGFVRKVDGRWYFTALGQSVWHIQGEGPGAQVRRDVEGMNFYQRDRNGAVVPAVQSLPEYATFSELQTATTGLVFGGEQ